MVFVGIFTNTMDPCRTSALTIDSLAVHGSHQTMAPLRLSQPSQQLQAIGMERILANVRGRQARVTMGLVAVAKRPQSHIFEFWQGGHFGYPGGY